jgi:hypothetical protein
MLHTQVIYLRTSIMPAVRFVVQQIAALIKLIAKSFFQHFRDTSPALIRSYRHAASAFRLCNCQHADFPGASIMFTSVMATHDAPSNITTSPRPVGKRTLVRAAVAAVYERKYDWNCFGSLLCSQYRRAGGREDYVNLEIDELSGQGGKPIRLTLRIPALDEDVFTST